MAEDKTVDEGSAADAAEDAEWAAALEDFAPGYDKQEEKADDKVTTETTTAETTTETTTEVPTTTETTTVDPNETPEQKTEREKAAADANGTDKSKDDAQEEPDTSVRTARQTAREAAVELDSVAKDVREKMFADVPTELRDADGDPIGSVADVTKLINPQTGEAFTREEATEWLLSAQQEFNKKIAQVDKQVEQIAEVNVDLKDQSESVNYQYGELLKSMPELRDQLWTEYEKTLIIDPKSGLITGMPVSLERYYEFTLQPYVKLAESLEAQESAKTAAEKAEAEVKKTRTRADRSDIYGRGKVDDMDDDEKEWANAAQEYYGTK
jgi:hypothetical protein